MKCTPLVSVIIPAYNHVNFVKESILSALKQNYGNFEIIVIDDCSTDDTPSRIEELTLEYNFIFIRNIQNIGLNQSLEKAISIAKGQFINIFASDDTISSDKLGEQIDYLLKNDLDGVYGNAISVENNSEHQINLKSFRDAFVEGKVLEFISVQDFSGPLIQSGLFKKEVFTSAHKIRINFKSDDWAFMIFVYSNFKIGFLDKSFVHYRLHQNNTHKRYWDTFPMRIDVVSRLVEERFKQEALGNILLSQGNYLFNDRKYIFAIKLFTASLILNFSFKSIKLIMKFIISRIIW